MFWKAAPSVFEGVLGVIGAYQVAFRSSSIFSINSSSYIALTASVNCFHVIGFKPTSLRRGFGSFLHVDVTRRLLVSGMFAANLSTLSAHTTCDISSSAPRFAATLFPRLLIFSVVLSRRACFSAVVFSVMGFTGH